MYKVLIVDDDDAIRKTIRRHLSKEGYGVLEAANGKEGVKMVEQHSPSVVLLDIMMPEMNGFECCQFIRKNFSDFPTYIIMLSAKGETDDKITGLDSGANDYISKPFDPEELKARIRAGIRTIEQRSQNLPSEDNYLEALLPINILLVSSDLETISLVKDVLKRVGNYEVMVAISPKKGLEVLRSDQKIGAIIMDEFESFNVNPLILAWQESIHWRNIPIMLLLKEASFGKLGIIRELGIQYVIVKPLTRNGFFEKFKKAIQIVSDLPEELVEQIRKVRFFKGLKVDEMVQIINLGIIREVEPQQVIISEKEVINKIFVIIRGTVAVYHIEGDQTNFITKLTSGNVMGETSLFVPSPSSKRILADTETTLFLLPHFAIPLLKDRIKEHLYRNIIIELTGKLSSLTEQQQKIISYIKSKSKKPTES